MTVNFGDIRSAIHSGGELPEGWMEDERALRYVRDHLDLNTAYGTVEDRGYTTVARVTCGNVVLYTVPQDEVEAFTGFLFEMRKGMSRYMSVTPPAILRTAVMNRICFGLPLRWR